MKIRAQNRNSLRPVSLNAQQHQTRPTTASFFFQQPKSKNALKRLTTEPCSLKNTYKKTKFYRYSGKHTPQSVQKNKEKQLRSIEKTQNSTPKELQLGKIMDWNQPKQPELKLKKTNTKIGSILRAIRGDLAQKLQIKEYRGLGNVAILGTKLL